MGYFCNKCSETKRVGDLKSPLCTILLSNLVREWVVTKELSLISDNLMNIHMYGQTSTIVKSSPCCSPTYARGRPLECILDSHSLDLCWTSLRTTLNGGNKLYIIFENKQKGVLLHPWIACLASDFQWTATTTDYQKFVHQTYKVITLPR